MATEGDIQLTVSDHNTGRGSAAVVTNDPSKAPVERLKCADKITTYPSAVCACSCVIILICVILSALVFDPAQQNSREFIVESDEYVIRSDALTLARENAADAQNAKVVESPQSKLDGLMSWVIYFRANKNTDFMLTKANIAIIMKYEGKIINPPEYKKYCLAMGSPTDYTCLARSPRNVRIPYQSLAYEIFSHPNYTVWTDADIKQYVHDQTHLLFNNVSRKFQLLPSMNKEYKDNGKVWFYRSTLFMGGPIPTTTYSPNNKTSIYKNRRDRGSEQRAEYNKYAIPLWEEITTKKQGKLMDGGLQIVAFSVAPLINEFGALIGQSSLFAFGSMTFVLLYLWFHLQSFWLASTGMMQILCAFPTAYFIYYYIYGIAYFGFLSYLIIFVLLGLGADDIFVLVDAFHQSEHLVDKANKSEEDYLLDRMSYTYRRAAKAMLVTQMTTFFAFLATSASVLMPVAAFGFWAATLVACNYFLVVTLYVAALVLWHKYIRHHERFGCCCGCCCPRPDESGKIPSASMSAMIKGKPVPDGTDGEDLETKETTGMTPADHHEPPAELVRQKSVEDVSVEYRKMERFFGITWVGFIAKYNKYILAVFAVIFSVGAYGASTLEPQTKDEQFFAEDHYFNFLFFVWPNEFYRGENDDVITVNWYWGLKGVDRKGTNRFNTSDYGTVIYDSNFDMTSVASQTFLQTSCNDLRNSQVVFTGVPIEERASCFIDKFGAWLNKTKNATYPYAASVPANQKNEFGQMLYEYIQVAPTNVIDVRKEANGVYTIKYVIFVAKSKLQRFDSAGETIKHVEDWNKFMSEQKAKCAVTAPKVCDPLFLDNNRAFTRLATGKAFVSSATTGIAISLPLAFVILILSTHNFLIAIFSVVDIGGVVVCELGIMAALGWQFGVSESIAVIMMIGFSVDYVVHLGHAYIECPFPGRLERLKYSMLTMGISVVSGGITTFGAGIFLSFPIFIFFRKIGLLLMTTIVTSLLWALLFFTSIMVLAGPQGNTGHVPVDKLFFCCPQFFEDHMGDTEDKKGSVEIR